MPEERGLYPRMKIRDQLVYFARLHGFSRGDARAGRVELLEFFDLGERADDMLDNLSLGNQQRVQIAAALVHRPTALVLDEPFSGLDPVAVDAMVELLHAEAADLPVLFSSHQLDLVERLCDDLVVLSRRPGRRGRQRRGPALRRPASATASSSTASRLAARRPRGRGPRGRRPARPCSSSTACRRRARRPAHRPERPARADPRASAAVRDLPGGHPMSPTGSQGNQAPPHWRVVAEREISTQAAQPRVPDHRRCCCSGSSRWW